MRIGFICEGATDLAVLENVFYGLFDEDDLLITELAPPPVDYTKPTYERNDRKGGWERLKEFLTTNEFKRQLDVHDYLLIHIDSDEGYHANFGVEINIKKNGDHEKFIIDIENKLIEWINSSSYLQYNTYQRKIIFCVCVHSIECWILAHHDTRSDEISKCENKMFTYLINHKVLKSATKDAKTFKSISRPLKKIREIDKLTERSQSFNRFIFNVHKIINFASTPIYTFLDEIDYRSLIMNYKI